MPKKAKKEKQATQYNALQKFMVQQVMLKLWRGFKRQVLIG
jgi:hypothetical protein